VAVVAYDSHTVLLLAIRLELRGRHGAPEPLQIVRIDGELPPPY
jgi:hypothetical protein